MNDSHSDFLSLPLWRRVLYTGWKGASCVGLHSGAWLFLELLCQSIWMVTLRRCPQWLTCRWAAPLEPRVVAASQLLHLATGASIFTWRLARWGIEGPGAEVSWDSLASNLLWSIKSGQPSAVLNALGSSWSLSHCFPCGDTSVRVFFNRTVQHEINFLGELVWSTLVLQLQLKIFHLSFWSYFLPGSILF